MSNPKHKDKKEFKNNRASKSYGIISNIIRIPEVKNGIEQKKYTFEEIMAENFPKFMTDPDVQRTQNRLNIR